MTARFLVGDVYDRLAELPDGSVDLVLTSPPFLALRSYLPDDHPDKHKEIGSEPTPAEFLDTLLALTAEWGRVLAPHGSLAVELGDTYAGSGGAGGDYNPSGLREGQQAFTGSAAAERITRKYGRVQSDGLPPIINRNGKTQGCGAGWPLDKSLVGIPQLYQLSLAYGRNLLTGEPSPAGQWRIRNLVAWVRPNPPVGALADKYRPATSYVTVATRERDRWFDLDAVRTPSDYHRESRYTNRTTPPGQRPNHSEHTTNPAGAPPLDWWNIPPKGYSGAHYAVWPPELCRIPIDSMCPRRVCATCGQPSRRITGRDGSLDPTRTQSARAMELAEQAGLTPDHTAAIRSAGITDAGKAKATQNGHGKNTPEVKRLAAEAKKALGGYYREFLLEVPTTTGWTSCGCPGADGIRLDGWHTGPAWRPGIVLDPFGGSGTTGAVATGMGRTCILIDLDERNADLARERIGMFLTVETQPEAAPA